MAGLLGDVGFGTTELTVLRPLDPSDGPFLRWLSFSRAFRGPAEGEMLGAGGLKRVPDDFVAAFPVALPPKSERLTIIDFLQQETAKIDGLIEAQRKLIELLKEKRQAVISHVVTKGLDPTAPIKPSGVEWLGDVPAHWELRSLRTLYRFVKRQRGDQTAVLSVYRDYGVILKDSRDDNINKTPDDLSLYQTVSPNDLVINKMKAWQGSLGVSSISGITSPDYVVFAPTHKASSEYFNFFLRCQLMPGVYRAISNGIRPDQWRLEPDKFKELFIPFPPIHEQHAIASEITEKLQTITELMTQAEAMTRLLYERRAALISAAVTGKIDLRHLRPSVTDSNQAEAA